MPLALVSNWATRWRHFHWLQIYPPGGATCIDCKLGHQGPSLVLDAKATRRHNFLLFANLANLQLAVGGGSTDCGATCNLPHCGYTSWTPGIVLGLIKMIPCVSPAFKILLAFCCCCLQKFGVMQIMRTQSCWSIF